MSIQENLDDEIENRFYYVDHDDSSGKFWWKDRLGKNHFMNDMGLDHLRASISLVKRDIENFVAHWEKFSNGPEVSKVLLPLAKSKLKELKEVYVEKSKLD